MHLHQIGLVTDRQALLPAALEVDGVIRLFVGIPDADFRCSIYTIDVNPRDPSEVLAMGEEPYCYFADTDGVVPAYVTPTTLWMSVFRRRPDWPFQMGIGWYRSPDEYGYHFYDDLIVGGVGWCGPKKYYACGDVFALIEGQPKPSYEVYSEGRCVLGCEGDEYRIGKPHVWHEGQYHMLCTAYALPDNRSYLVYATSPDGLDWQRQPFTVTGDVFASPIYAYRCGGWVFFNGTGRGEGGVGYGRLVD